MKDLKGGKGDLEGLYPYLVAQIIDLESEGLDDSSGVLLVHITSSQKGQIRSTLTFNDLASRMNGVPPWHSTQAGDASDK